MLYRFEVQQLIKFEVYDIDTNLHDLKSQDFLGSCETTLGHVIYNLIYLKTKNNCILILGCVFSNGFFTFKRC